MLRTHNCGELRIANVGEKVTICGWVQKARDYGHFMFVDMRDRYGITQVSVDADNKELYEIASALGREYVIQVSGTVIERENKNANRDTGDIEINPDSIEILNESELPPFKIEDKTDGLEDLRLEYRYLDLRRPEMANRMVLRAKTMRAVREYLDAKDFLEIETPVLIKSTPEGARDFLVPSRLHKGSFYALPQSPQILKQLLMVAGMDRYYQIVKCFRDEDSRGDRQPEFTQIDCEMSFATQEDVFETFEGMTQHVFKQVLGIDIPPFQKLRYDDALRLYGSDKPDLRFGCEIVELNEAFTGSGFGVFDGIMESGGLIAGINAKGCASYSNGEVKKKLEAYIKDANRYGGRQAKGLTWIRFQEDGSLKSSLPNSIFDDEKLKAIGAAMNAEAGDLLLIVADRPKRSRKYLGDLRLVLADREGWRKEGDWSILWIVDFPLFEWDEDDEKRVFAHHPFVMPAPEHLHLLDTEPDKVYAHCYDLVMNGNEIVSGSVRIHRPDIQAKIFDLLGMDKQEQEDRFGFMLKAFKYGAPPHAGCAFGLDRWVALMAGGETIRDVIAFPKVSSGRDPMMDAPSPVDEPELKVLGIQIREEEKPNAQ